MQTLQANHDAGDQGALQPDDQGALGVLESPGELIVRNDGARVAVLTEPLTLPTQHEKDGMTWQKHKYSVLRWEPVFAQLMLQGASAQLLLGAGIILTRGEHRPPYDPRPGMDNVTVVQVLMNPRRLDVHDTFMIVAG